MRKLRSDRRGGLEGMPLQLLILVIVAGVALAVILGWVLSLPPPAVIKNVSLSHTSLPIPSAPIDTLAKKTVSSFSVSAYDSEGKPVNNVLVTLEGAVTGGHVTRTDGDDNKVDGVVTFTTIEFRLPPGAATGSVRVSVQKPGYTAPAPIELLVYRS
jgi:hypothetical protein